MNPKLYLAFCLLLSGLNSTGQKAIEQHVKFSDIEGFSGSLIVEIYAGGYYFEPYFTAKQKDVYISSYENGKYNALLQKAGISFPYKLEKAGRFDFKAKIVLEEQYHFYEQVEAPFNTTDNLGSGQTFPPFSKRALDWLKSKGEQSSAIGKEVSGGKKPWLVYGRIESIEVTKAYLLDFKATLQQVLKAHQDNQDKFKQLLHHAEAQAAAYNFTEAVTYADEAADLAENSDMRSRLSKTRKIIAEKKEEQETKEKEEAEKKEAAEKEKQAAGDDNKHNNGRKKEDRKEKEKEEEDDSEENSEKYYPKTYRQLYDELKEMTDKTPALLNNPDIRKQLRDYKSFADLDDRNMSYYKAGALGNYSPQYKQTMSKVMAINSKIASVERTAGDIVDATTGLVNSIVDANNRKNEERWAEQKNRDAQAMAKKKAIAAWEHQLLENRKSFENKTVANIKKDYKLLATIPDQPIQYETEVYSRGKPYWKGQVSITPHNFTKTTATMKDWNSVKSYLLFVVEQNGLFGILGDAGEPLYPPQFSGIYVYRETGQRPRFLVNINNKWGELLADGRIAEDIRYDGIWYLADRQTKILRWKDTWTVKSFDPAAPVPGTIGSSEIPAYYSGGLIPVSNTLSKTYNDRSGSYSLAADGTIYVWGTSTEKGVESIPYESARTGEVTERLFRIRDNWYITTGYGTKEMTVAPMPASFVIPVLRETDNGKKWGAIDQHGNIIIPFEHTSLRRSAQGFIADNGEYDVAGNFTGNDLQEANMAGAKRDYYNNGQLKSIGKYDANGEAYDTWIFYHENGKMSRRGKYSKGFRSGKWTFYHQDGAVDATIHYPEGISTVYYANGNTKGTGPGVRGKRNGTWTFYFEDGNRYAEGSYENGKKTGEWKFFHDNGQTESAGTFKQDEYYGEWTSYYKSGQLLKQGVLTGNRIAQGTWKFYFENGQLSAEGNFENNKKTGEWKEYHENGQLKEKGRYKNGEKKGKWLQFDENGKILK